MKYALALLTGVVAAFSMQPYNLFPLLFIGLSGFWWLLSTATRKRDGYALGFLFGLGYFTAGMWWIGNALLVGGSPFLWALPFAIIGIPTILALYPMLAGGIIATYAREKSFTSFLSFVILIGIGEWIRGHAFTGLPWNLFGMAWAHYPPILQIANVFGIYGLSLLTIFIGSVGGFLWRGDMSRTHKIYFTAFTLILCGAIFAYGTVRLNQNPTDYNKNIAVRLISPNIPQNEKWNPVLYSENFVKTLDAMNVNFMGTQNLPAPIRILLLPETALNGDFFTTFDDKYARDHLKRTLKQYPSNTYLFTGALSKEYFDDSKATYFNSLLAVDSNLELKESFNKSHLVPFGEYIPFQNYIPLAPITNFENLGRGDGVTTWEIDKIPPVSPLVCYEIIFPRAVTANTPLRPHWIANATNDAWYGISPGPYQHLAQAQTRAVEEGVPVARAANTGISAMIDPYGRIITASPLFKTDARETYLPLPTPHRTLYSLYGDLLFWLLCLGVSLPILINLMRNKKIH